MPSELPLAGHALSEPAEAEEVAFNPEPHDVSGRDASHESAGSDARVDEIPDIALPPSRNLTLELALHPEDAARLTRLPEVARRRDTPQSRAVSRSITWHDSPSGALAADGLALAEHRIGRSTLWRLERLQPDPREIWAPGTPAPVLAEASEPALLGRPLPSTLVPVAGFDGTARTFGLDHAGAAVSVTVYQGVLRAVAGEHPCCRVVLDGEAGAIAALAHILTEPLRLTVPPAAFAAEAFAVARQPPPPRHLGAPALPTGIAVGDAFAFVAAHLADVILYYAPKVLAGETPEPVHQMRVALRRLKSALALFRKAVHCPPLDAAKPALRALSHVLGPARDWDVFTGGTASAVAAAFPDDPAVGRLVASAHRRRAECYAALTAYLESAAFRHLCLMLATLTAMRPWEREPALDASADPEMAVRQSAALTSDLVDYAARALQKRLRALLEPGADISHLTAPELHAIRLHGKRLRYAAEFFSPLFPRRETRRFVRRVAELQERLGHLNDGSVAAGLLEELGSARGYAAGVVRGFVAAGSADSRGHIVKSWKKLRRQDAFWR